MTTALMALFAACTNDDFISNEQGIQSGEATMRPSVDVTLNVLGDGEGADTRLYFDGNRYQWEVGDTIGALLMDNVIAKAGGEAIRPHDDIEQWEDMAWTSRYELVDYINTNYPFVRQSDKTWTTNAKMLEGNYFFAFPFASYSGNREAIHSLGEQVQNGSTMEAVQEAYAKNQFFIGYSRIFAGTEGGDVMNASLDMTSVLGPVYVQVQNTGNKPFTVQKIVLESTDFNTLIKINPTKAVYDGEDVGVGEDTQGTYNLNGSKPNPAWTIKESKYFNYANYEEDYANDFKERYASVDDIHVLGDELVNNTKKSSNYNRQEALRAVIEGIEGVPGADKRAELTVVGADPLYGDVSASVTQTFVVMANGNYKYDETNKDNPVMLTIYTDRGMVGPVNISAINSEVNGGAVDTDGDGKKDVTVISQNAVTEINPGNGKNIVTLEIDDNSVQEPWNMNVYNNDDLLKYIEWNKAATTLRVFTAELKNDVTLTKEMSDLLTQMNSKLLVNTNGKKLIIAENAASNILDYVMVRNDGKNEEKATIIVNNALTLGSKSYVNGVFKTGLSNIAEVTLGNELEVAENGSVTVATPITYETEATNDYRKQALVIAENEGNVEINAVVEKLTIAENKANVAINANVTFVADSKNEENATITIAKGAIVSAGGMLQNVGKNYYKDDREAAEYAIIYNNGRINNLVNGKWGMVIAGEGSITSADSNAGIIDISADIKAEWSVDADDKGIVSYTATKETALKDVIESEITELVVDGGSVTATQFKPGVAEGTDAAYNDAKKVETIIVKGKGGSIGTTEYVNGTKTYYRTVFSAATLIETTANAAFTDVDFTASDIDFNIEAATTTINKVVKANNADIVLGSYDEKNYKANDATLDLPSKDSELYAKSIEKYGNDKVTAKVMNQGKVELPHGVTVGEGVDVEGNGTVPGEEVTPDKVFEKTEVEISADGEYTSLRALSEKLSKYDDITALKTIVISRRELDLSDEDNADYVNVLEGKDVVLSGNLMNVDNGDLLLGTLTLQGESSQISGAKTDKTVMLKVAKLVAEAGSKTSIRNSYLQVDGDKRELSSDGVEVKGDGQILTFKTGGSYTGAIVATNAADPKGPFLIWNEKNKQWENQ